jgi:hypothetical protein
MKKMFSFLIVALLASGCLNYELEETETREWPSDDLDEIIASTENGGITASVADAGTVTAVITRRCKGRDKSDAEDHIDNVVVEDAIVDNQLHLSAEMPSSSNRGYGASFDIDAPAQLFLDLSTSNGSISIQGFTGGALLRTSNGGIDVVELQDGIDAHTSNGAITCDLTALGTDEEALLSTSNGRITLTLPGDVDATFEAHTSNGSVEVSGFDDIDFDVNDSTHKTGTIGNGGATISLSTSNGGIILSSR